MPFEFNDMWVSPDEFPEVYTTKGRRPDMAKECCRCRLPYAYHNGLECLDEFKSRAEAERKQREERENRERRAQEYVYTRLSDCVHTTATASPSYYYRTSDSTTTGTWY